LNNREKFVIRFFWIYAPDTNCKLIVNTWINYNRPAIFEHFGQIINNYIIDNETSVEV